MSLKKYSIFVVVGMCSGIMLAYIFSFHISPRLSSRSIASDKNARYLKVYKGKPGSSLSVQIQKLPESHPERGYYKLLATVVFNRPMQHIRYQWALPNESRAISSDIEGEIYLKSGEEGIEKVIELQLTETKRDSQILFDINFEENGVPMGTSDIFVFRALPF